MVVKQADIDYVKKEINELLNVDFSIDEGNFGKVATKDENIVIKLLYKPDWNSWLDAMYYTAFSTWNNGYEINLENEKSIEKRRNLTLNLLKKRPISACYESAMFVIKIDNVSRAMTHQIVRARRMAFNQQSFRVSPAHHSDFRIPNGLDNELKKEIENKVNNDRNLYLKLINNGIPTEMARNVLGMGTCTNIVMTTNLPALKQYINDRTINLAQDEHTYIALRICKELEKNATEFYNNFIKNDKIVELMKLYKI